MGLAGFEAATDAPNDMYHPVAHVLMPSVIAVALLIRSRPSRDEKGAGATEVRNSAQHAYDNSRIALIIRPGTSFRCISISHAPWWVRLAESARCLGGQCRLQPSAG